MKWFNLSDNVNLLSIIGAIIIVAAVFIVVSNAFKQMKKKREDVELSEHTWDGIGEYKNPLPLGWALMFVVLIVFALWYFLVAYPLNKYSSIGEYNEAVKAHDEKFKAKFETLSMKQKENMGEGLFVLHCAPCHGLNAMGMNGKAQDLTVWGSAEGIVNTIMNGSTGLGFGEMPAGLLDEDEAKEVAQYIMNGMKGDAKDLFIENCASCHGEDGEGMEDTAPAINIYSDASFVENVLISGKDAPSDAGVKVIGKMPSFKHSLSKEQMQALGIYVKNLSKE